LFKQTAATDLNSNINLNLRESVPKVYDVQNNYIRILRLCKGWVVPGMAHILKAT